MLEFCKQGMQNSQSCFQVADHNVVCTWFGLWNAGLLHEEEGKIDVLQLLFRRRNLQVEFVERDKVAFEQTHQKDKKYTVLKIRVSCFKVTLGKF